MKLTACFKIYNCLLTPLKDAIEETINGVVYGYTTIGNKILNYIYIARGDEFNGCFLSSTPSNLLANFSSHLHNYSDFLMNNCINSTLKIKDLFFDTAEGTKKSLQQRYVFEGPYTVDLSENFTVILNNNYSVINDTFYYNGNKSFYGIVEKCHFDDILKYTANYNATENKLVDFNDLSGAANNVNPYDIIKNLVLGTLGVVVLTGGVYMLYKNFIMFQPALTKKTHHDGADNEGMPTALIEENALLENFEDININEMTGGGINELTNNILGQEASQA